MNKVFYVEEDVAEEEGRKIIENAKRVFINFFGKKYEGRICSNLDYSDYVYFNERKGMSGRSVFFYYFYGSELGQYIFDHFQKLDADQIRKFLADLIFDGVMPTMAASIYSYENNRLEQISFLPTEAANQLYLHELLHVISVSVIGNDGGTKKSIKSGFGVGTFGVGLNEIFTEYLAYKINKYMKDNKLPLLVEGNSLDSAYLKFFDSLAPFIEKHYDVLLRSYFGDNLSACYETFGKENFDNILNKLDTMVKKEIFKSSELDSYLLAAEEYAQNTEEKQA